MNNTAKVFGGIAVLAAVALTVSVCRDNRPKPTPTPTPPAPTQTAPPSTPTPIIHPTPPPVPTGTPPSSAEPVLPVAGRGGLLPAVDGPPPLPPCSQYPDVQGCLGSHPVSTPPIPCAADNVTEPNGVCVGPIPTPPPTLQCQPGEPMIFVTDLNRWACQIPSW